MLEPQDKRTDCLVSVAELEDRFLVGAYWSLLLEQENYSDLVLQK